MDYKPGISLYPTSGAQPRLGPYVPEVHIPDEATKEQRKRAVRTFSLTFFALFLFDLCASLVIYGIQFGTIFLYGESGANYLFENIWFTYGAQAVAMYLIAFPIYYLVLRKLPFHEQGSERGALTPGRIHRERLVMGRGWQGEESLMLPVGPS